MTALLTTEEAQRLLQLPKRLVDRSEFAWAPNIPPPSGGRRRKLKQRVQNPRRLRARLINTGTRHQFQLIGHSNGRFGFTLRWREFDIARIDCGAHKHRDDHGAEIFIPSGTPHIHTYTLGRGLDVAIITDNFNCSDANGALLFFARYCNIQDIPDIQLTLELKR